MTIFLPAADAGRTTIGDEARIVLDPIPDRIIPASVSFVAADAQFTPKTVETKDERAKLMFRLKLKIDPDVLQAFYTRVKTGIRGLGFVRTKADVAWPAELEVNVKAPPPKATDAAAPAPRRGRRRPRLRTARRPSQNDRRTDRASQGRIAPVRRDGLARRRLDRHPVADHGRRDRPRRRRQVDPAWADRGRAQHPAGRGRRLRQERRRQPEPHARSAAASPTCRRASAAISIRR